MFRPLAKSLSLALVLLLTMGIAFGVVVSDSDYQALKTKIAAGDYLSRADINTLIDLHDAGQSIVSDWELNQLKANGRIGERPVQNRRPGNPLDEYVYTEITYNFHDISTETGVIDIPNLSDDGVYRPYDLGFTFTLYDEPMTQISICSNGYISNAANSTGDWTNNPIPDVATPNPVIAPFWDDLWPNNTDNPGQIFFWADPSGDRAIVQWDHCVSNLQAGPGPQTVQVQLFANGNMEFHYHTINGGDSCTVGIENSTGTEGVQACFNGTGDFIPASNTAIRINQPDGVPNPVTSLAGSATGTTVTLTWDDPTEDTNGNAITVGSVEVWLGPAVSGTLLGTVAAGVETYVHPGAPEGFVGFSVRPFLTPYYGRSESVTVLVGDQTIYSSDFELSDGNWVSSGGWEWGTPSGADAPTPHSGSNVWGTVLTGNYPINACFQLDLELGQAISSSESECNFWAYWDIEGTPPDFIWDGCNFKVSVDQGTTWEVVQPSVGAYSGLANEDNVCVPGEPVWSEHPEIWTQITIPLGDYAGFVPMLRFEFGSDGSVLYPGFYIDDMTINGLGEPAYADVSGTVTLDGGAGSVTDATVYANGPGDVSSSPAGDGSYTLTDVLQGDRTIWAELAGYHNGTANVNVPEGGVNNVDLTLVRLDPPVPTGLDASVSNTTGIATLTWDASTDPLVDRYNIFRKLQEDDDFVNIGSAGTTTYDDDLNTPGPGIYQYAISAIDLDVTTPVESEMTDPVTVLYGELPPSGLSANGNFDDKIVLDWFEPGTPPEFELFYDHGGDSDVDGLGWWGGLPTFGWMAAKFETSGGPATVTRIKVKFTSFATEGDLVQVGVFEDNGGEPTFEPLGVVDYTLAPPFDVFVEFELPAPVTLSDGIIWVGVRQTTSNSMAVGGDQLTTFINDHFKYSFDATEWVAYEPNLLTIPMLRCFAIGSFGAEIEMTPEPIDVERMPVSDLGEVDGKTIVGVEIPNNWMTTSADYTYNYNALVERASNAVASHAPNFRPVENRRNNNSLDDVDYYIVYRDDVDIAHPTTEHYEDTGLEENIEYDYYVTAYYDNEVESGATTTVTKACNMAPAAPTSLAGSTTGSQMLITWVDPIANADGSSCVDLANIKIYRNGTLVSTVAAGVEEYLDTPPVLDQFYTWTVTAVDEVPNESDASEAYIGAVQSPWLEVDYEWVDISGSGSTAAVDDDGAAGPFNLGFNFEFFGDTYSSLFICSNGFATFGAADSSLTNTELPNSAAPNGAIYPFWDDLNPAAAGQVLYYADAANERFIISWIGVPHFNTEDYYTFQAIISATGSVLYNYHTIVVNNTCTIGVENADGTDGIQLCFDGEGSWLASSSTAVEFWGGPSGEIAGVVRRLGTNAPIQGAEVTVAELPGPVATTNAAGEYSLNVEPGTYTVHVTAQGYCDIDDPNVVVEDNTTTTRFYTMNYPDGSSSTSSVNLQTPVGVDVSGQFDLVNGSNATCELSYTVTADEDWVSFTPDAGDLAANSSTTIQVNVDASGLAQDTYNATITVTSNDENSPFEIDLVVVVGVAVDDPGFIPTEFAFYQNYPNPFNATTALQFDVPTETAVKISIYNVMGQLVDTPVNANYPAGRFKVMYTADALPSGMYLVKMDAGSFNGLHKMVLLK